MPGENNKKKTTDNGVDGHMELKKRSKGSEQKYKIDEEGGKKKCSKKPMKIPDTNPSENVNTENNEGMASDGGQQINDKNNEKKLPKKRHKKTNDEGGKGDVGKSKKPKKNHTNGGDFKFVCDICRLGFFVKGEYKCHCIGHTDLKPYACGVCGEAKFAMQGQLNAHLQRCGKPNQFECQICYKTYSTDQNWAVHVREVHKKNTSEQVTWECPLYEGSV